jgi:hypothetical protein
VIHNSPNPTVDVWANDDLLIDNFVYRTATPFIFVPAGVDIDLGVALDTSTSAASSVATFPVNLENGKTYIVTAAGFVGDPDFPFTLVVNPNGREIATDTGNVDIAIIHGALQAPQSVDVDALFVGNNVITNLNNGSFSPYLSLAPDKYDFAVREAGTQTVSATFRADLSGLKGGAAYVFVADLLGGDPSFGLFAAFPNGTVTQLLTTRTARVQVIHNSPEPTVDVYAGNTLLLDNFAFRTATPFVTLPADRDIVLGIALDNSTSSADALATFTASFEEGKTYGVTASGVVGDPGRPFTLLVDAEAREAAADPGDVDFNVLHGAIDAPAVDVDVVGIGNIIADLAYSEQTTYLSVDPDNYLLQVRPAGSPTVVGTFQADLSGLAGGAARVFASGYLNGTPGFGLFAALPNGTVVEFPAVAPPATARLQVIHNSAAPTVDIYANDDLLIDDFVYRTATSFIDVPAEVAINIGVALGNSQSVNDVLATFPVTFEEGKTYVVTASGIVGDPTTPFTLIVDENGRETAAIPGQVDIAVIHGSTNAPAVDVDAVFVANNVVSDLAYGEFTPYLGLAPDKYDLAIRAAGDPNVVASFRADLSGLAGGAAYVFASGALGGTPAFGLFAALPNGDVLALPLTRTARVQVIHNSPEPTVDVYAGNTLLLDNFAFRTATPFVTLPADRDIVLGIALDNSTSSADALATFTASFEEGKTYGVTASGVVGDPGRPFTLLVDAEAREAAADPGNVDFNVLHGAIDAPAVDVDVVGIGNIIADLAYSEQTTYLSVDPDNYLLQVRPAGSPTVVGTFQADLSGLAGGAARVFASGYLNGTPGFGLFAALPNGTVVEFPAVAPPATARLQVIHNSAAPTVDIYANDDLLIDNFVYRTATSFIDVPAEVAINIGVALGNSQSVNDVLATFPVTFEEGKTYVVTASGIVGDPTTPFTLIVDENGRETAAIPGQVDIAVIHGSTNAPAVDVDAVFVANNVVSDLAYGAFTPYLSLAPDKYDLAVRATGDQQVVASYRADLSGLAGGAAYVFASGALGGTPAFGLFAALPNGEVLQLPLTPTARVQVLHNAPSPTVDVYAGNTLLLNDFAFRTATPYIDFPAGRDVAFGIAPANSTSATDAIATFNASFAISGTYLVAASGVVGSTTTPFALIIDGNAAETAQAGAVRVSVLHGAPDAPAVDVVERLNGTLVNNLAYGAFTPYLTLPAEDNYYLDVKAAGVDQIVATYRADLAGLQGLAIRVFASGFLGGTPGFGLYAAPAQWHGGGPACPAGCKGTGHS